MGLFEKLLDSTMGAPEPALRPTEDCIIPKGVFLFGSPEEYYNLASYKKLAKKSRGFVVQHSDACEFTWLTHVYIEGAGFYWVVSELVRSDQR